MSAGMWFAAGSGAVIGAVPVVFVVYVAVKALVLAVKDCAAGWRRRSER